MNLSIVVYDRVSLVDVLINAVQKLVRYLFDLFQERDQTDVEDAIEEVVKVEEATGPPSLGIGIVEEVRTGDGLV